jgi:hypothetical protein
VKIYCGTISIDPVAEYGPKRITASWDWVDNDFWKVAEVTWDGYGCTVRTIDVIVPASAAQTSR